MTQGEIEVVVREIRTRSLHLPWNDLFRFWQGVVGNLERAYRASVQSTAPFHHMSSGHPNDMQRMVRDELATALRQLVGERQVVRWHAEATGGIESMPASKDDTL